MSPHTKALLQALFVTFLWSTSWVLIKIGLDEIPALTFAGLRYGLAFVCLLPFALRGPALRRFHALRRRDWAWLILLGLLYYAITQGSQFLGLAYLPAASVSLLLNFTSALVALLGILLLNERLAAAQWAGIGLFLAGTLLYFYPVSFPARQWFGLGVVAVGVIANALSSILGRSLNRRGDLSPLVITTASMGAGALIMLAAGLAQQGLPRLSPQGWLIIAWLAVVNTALAFTLWNHTLRTLTAVESSVINNTMLIQIAVLAWLFLGERLDWRQILGMVAAAAGVLVVQLAAARPRRLPAAPAATVSASLDEAE